jgi:hypothetical protein
MEYLAQINWKKYALPLVVLLLGLANSCQFKVNDADLPSPEQYVVVNADLTPHYGKITVTLTASIVTPVGGYLFPPPPPIIAYVEDGQGQRHDFNQNGVVDSTFKGKVGETYQLYLLVNGREYLSDKETMRPCPAIDSVSAVFSVETNRAPSDNYYYGYDFYAHFTDKPGQGDFYQWDWIHYERTSECETVFIENVEYYLPCTPYDCWGVYRNRQTIVQSDQLRDGLAFAKRLHRAPFVLPPPRYYLNVEQRSITPSAFEYLRSIEVQSQGSGSMFDVPAQTRFCPNIQNINDPEEKLLGLFNVYDTQSKVHIVNMTKPVNGLIAPSIAFYLPRHPDPLAQAPCIASPTRTLKRPIGWQD